jgi:hypothetical protein
MHTPNNLHSRSVSFRRSSFARLAAVHLAVAGLLAAAVPTAPASATYYAPTPYRASKGDYQACANGLSGTGVTDADAAAACAASLYPRDLSRCVTRINGGTAIKADDALSGCRRVRRPTDLATCVVDISTSGKVEEAALNDVLDNCRRSLLPLRFSNCVVGLKREIDFSIADAMTDCISASNRPRDVLPSFIPTGQPLPDTVPTPEPLMQSTPAPIQPAPVQPTPQPTPPPSGVRGLY